MGEQRAERPEAVSTSDKPDRPKAKLVFDDPLDRQTGDDTDSGWGERPGGSDGGGGRGLDWYLSQRPPHHG